MPSRTPRPESGRWRSSLAVLLLAWMGALHSADLAAEKFIVRDDVGRLREFAAPVAQIAAAGGPAEVLLYTLAPQRLAGWNREPSPAARRYIPVDLQPKAVISRLPEARDASRDADFLALAPGLIVDYGSVHADYVARANAIEARLGIPYLVFDGRLTHIPETYRRLGPLVGSTARGDQLADLSQRMLDKYRGLLADSPQRRIYVTDSADGLSPVFGEQSAAEIFIWLGLDIVVDPLDDARTRPTTFTRISQWQPEAVFALHAGLPTLAATDQRWQSLPAVRDGKLFAAPRLPFDWIARPPSVNRLLGLVWVAMVLSPAERRAGCEQDLRELFAVLLHRPLVEGELEQLLGTP